MSGCLCNQLVHLNIHSFKIYSLFQGQLARHWSPRSCFGLDVTRCKRVASAVMGQHWNLGYRRKEGRKCGTFLNSKRKSESSCSTEDSKMCLSFLSGSSYSVISGQCLCLSTAVLVSCSTSLLFPCLIIWRFKGQMWYFLLPVSVKNTSDLDHGHALCWYFSPK